MLTILKRLLKRLSWGYSGDKYYGRLARKYQKRREKKKWWHQENKVVRDYLKAMPDGITVVDVPFGTGRFVPYYLGKSMQVYGLDSSPEMLRAAGELLEKDFEKCETVVGDAAQLPYEDNFADLVVCFRFLQSIIPFSTVKAVLKEFHRVTRSRALLELKVRHDRLKDADPPKEDRSIRDTLKMDDIRRLLGDAGFEIEEVIPVSRRKTHVLAAFACRKK